MNNNKSQQNVFQIDHKSRYLDEVIKLGDKNSKTLGFLPSEAYIKHAKKSNIIVGINSQNLLTGYLLYNSSRNEVRLTHLCVAEEYRGQGIARTLLQYLKQVTQDMYGIKLSCRRDYNLEKMWATLGFVAVAERPGRGKDQKCLTEWWLNYGHPNLITRIAETTAESKISAVIDANVFYDLMDQEGIDEESKESQALDADWIKSEVELFLTDEIHNEINRHKDEKRREKLRQAVTEFQFSTCSQEAFEISYQILRKLFPKNMSNSDESDLRQLARTVGSTFPISFFVTRDQRLLSLEDEIYQDFKVLVIRPTDLIVHLDELKRETEYQPVRLKGTSIRKQLIQPGNQDLLSNLFLTHSEGERKSDFKKQLRQFLAEPQKYECFVFEKDSESPLALIVYDRNYKNELNIRMLRFKNERLQPTLTRYCLLKCVSDSAQENRHFTRISDSYMDNTTIKAIQDESGFIQVEKEWLKVNRSVIQTSSEIASQLSSFSSNLGKNYSSCQRIADVLLKPESMQNSQLASNLERILWPAKIVDAEIPCFIIPIKAWWAKDLVDQRLTQHTIWGANEELALRREVVYYRSSSSFGLKAPARILWYVSHDKGFRKGGAVVKAIRACSRLEKIVIDSPDNLHRRFRRLGVYDKNQIQERAKSDKVMAIQFSDIELLKNPIELEKIKEVLGASFVPQTVKEVSKEEFMILYSLGKSDSVKS